MKVFLRQILAAVCLVAFVCGGQMTACACAIAPADAPACGAHANDNGEHKHHDHTVPGADAQCPCKGCHTCSHLPMLVPAVTLPAVNPQPVIRFMTEAPVLVSCSREVFIPPKV